MKITCEPTPEVFILDGLPCRVWRGRTEAGAECRLYVCLVQHTGGPRLEFEQELVPVAPARLEGN